MSVYIPVTQHEMFDILPASVRSEWMPTEGEHWTVNDARNELLSLCLTAMRACRKHVSKGCLVINDAGDLAIKVKDKVKVVPSFYYLSCYLTTNEMFEIMRKSGISYSANIH